MISKKTEALLYYAGISLDEDDLSDKGGEAHTWEKCGAEFNITHNIFSTFFNVVNMEQKCLYSQSVN